MSAMNFEATKVALKHDKTGIVLTICIHPDQIRPILRAFAPPAQAVEQAQRIIEAALAQDWAPIAVDGVLHDRASYRYFWNLLESAHRSGVRLAPAMQSLLSAPVGAAH